MRVENVRFRQKAHDCHAPLSDANQEPLRVGNDDAADTLLISASGTSS